MSPESAASKISPERLKKYADFVEELQRVTKEVADIQVLIPQTGTPGEQRQATIAIVRQKLTEASDLAVVRLSMEYHHQLEERTTKTSFRTKRYVSPCAF